MMLAGFLICVSMSVVSHCLQESEWRECDHGRFLAMT